MTISTKQICDHYREGVCQLCHRSIALSQNEDPDDATCIACFLGLRDHERQLLNRDDFALGLMCDNRKQKGA
jgi:hypothetical protein